MRMRYLMILVAYFAFLGIGTIDAQSRYQVNNSLILKNQDCDLTRFSLILPAPVNNIYQDISGMRISSGEIIDIDGTPNKYLRDLCESDLPGRGEEYRLSMDFSVTLYPMYIDMDQFTTLYPYDTESEIYKKYTINKNEYIDTNNIGIRNISDQLWQESNGDIIAYARLCYEYVATHFKYLNPNTGIHPIAKILSDGGGDCGNLASIFVNLLRAKKIPAKHIVTVRPDGTYHVWADFYLEKYGWIPVDVNRKLDDPQGNYFGYCLGDGIVMSEDILHNIEFVSGGKYEAVILQTFYFWYWCMSGHNIDVSQQIQANQESFVHNPIISNVNAQEAIVTWDPVYGATEYRLEIREVSSGTMVDQITKDSDSFNHEFSGLNPDTDYEIALVPLRKVGNIETQMGWYYVRFRTDHLSTINEVVEDVTTSVWGNSGSLFIRSDKSGEAFISTFMGRSFQSIPFSAGETRISLPNGYYIVKIGDEVFKIAL